MNQRPVHFEIHASDPAAVGAFYQELFGWQISQWGHEEYWLVATGDGDPMQGRPDSTPGINGAILPRRGAAPAPGAPVTGWVVTVEVDNATATAERAVGLGAQVALPVQSMTGVGDVGYLIDPDGNIFGVISPESPAPAPEDDPGGHA